MAEASSALDAKSNNNEEQRLRIKERRAIPKFGECREQGPGAEHGITCVSQIAFPVIWSHEEKQRQAEEAKKKKSGPTAPKKAYVPVHDRRNPYSIKSEEKRRKRRPQSQKAEELLTYCKSCLPPEPKAGGKKKKKAKKQKLKHPLEFVSIFMELGIKPPKTTKDLPDTISELEAYFNPEESVESPK